MVRIANRVKPDFSLLLRLPVRPFALIPLFLLTKYAYPAMNLATCVLDRDKMHERRAKQVIMS